MNKPGIFAAIAVAIIGVIAIVAASTATPSMPSSFGAQIEPLPMMANTNGLPVQRVADLSVVFVEPVGP
jgi:hypothetical protein